MNTVSRRVVVATGYDAILKHVAHALGRSGHQVVGALTMTGGAPVADAAGAMGVPCFTLPLLPGEMNVARAVRRDPAYLEQVRAALDGLAQLEADFLVGWGVSVLPAFVLESARHAINVHPSDLPRYRGGFPLEAQILDGQRALYVSVHDTTSRIDDGRVLARSPALKIKRSDTMSGLLNRSLPVGASLVAGTVSHWGHLPPVTPPVVVGELPHAWGIRRVRGPDGRLSNHGVLGRLRVEWTLDTAEDISRAARAFDMIGGAYTNLGDAMFRITRARVVSRTVSAPPGQVLAVDADGVEAQALDAVVRLQGAIAGSEVRPAPGDRFTSTTPISQLLVFRDAER